MTDTAYDDADPRELGGMDEQDAAEEVVQHPAEPRRDPLPPEEVERRWRDTQRGLKEERGRRREMERELAELRGRVSATPQQAQERQQPSMPNPDEDPMGAIQYLMRKVGEYEGQTQQQRQVQERQTAEQRDMQQLGERIVESEADFKLAHPDFDDAVAHYKSARAQEMIVQGVPQGQVQGELTNEILSTARRAFAADKDPCDIFYNLAKRRGYGVDKGVDALQTNGDAQSRPAPRSLSSVGSRSGPGTLTIESVNKLTGPEFDKAKRKLVGRA